VRYRYRIEVWGPGGRRYYGFAIDQAVAEQRARMALVYAQPYGPVTRAFVLDLLERDEDGAPRRVYSL
jgi:hypothetical protein